MVFNSLEFLLFFPLIYLVYLKLNQKKQNVFLLISSYFFYGYWDYRFLSLLFVSTIVDYFAAIQIENSENEKTKKYFLYLSLFSNLSILGFFKYFNFFIESATNVLTSFGVQANPYTLKIILPLGISFYTFQTLSYTVDVYRKDLKAERDFLDFALFVTFFPQLVAGPIERATSLIPQIKSERKVTLQGIEEGGLLILIGLFKKVYIADNLAMIVDPIFSSKMEGWNLLREGSFANFHSLTSAECLVGMSAFILQIYGDFAGYSDIARGLSKFMGFELIRNFKHPFFAESMNDFWRRWHISFMNWLRDYVLKVIGKKTDPEPKQHLNNIFVFTLSGLWHGANWTFVVWGFYCGVVTSFFKLYEKAFPKPENYSPILVRRIINSILTFITIIISASLFRSPNIEFAMKYFYSLFTNLGGIEKNELTNFLRLSFILFLVEFHQFKHNSEYSFFQFKTIPRSLIYILLFYLIIIFGNCNNGFIYFVF